MKKLLLGLAVISLMHPIYAQLHKAAGVKELSEVVVYATNYRYLQNVKTEQAASLPVKMLERKAAEFDVKH